MTNLSSKTELVQSQTPFCRIKDITKSNTETEFRTIVETFGDKVRCTCYHYVNNSEDANDIAQDVFIQVYKSLESFQHGFSE